VAIALAVVEINYHSKRIWIAHSARGSRLTENLNSLDAMQSA